MPAAVSTPSQARRPDAPVETLSGLIVSLLFWLSILVAAVSFAAVGLSPKLVDQSRLYRQFQENQHQLILMERQNERLEKVVEAIRSDKDFAAEMTRIEFDAVRPGEEIIPVEPELRLAPQDTASLATLEPVAEAWFQPLILPLAEDDTLRNALLGTAVALVIVSFTWFQPAGQRCSHAPSQSSPKSVWTMLRSRYVRSGT